MRVVVQPARIVAQASRHPEVNEQSPVRFEPNNQILAATLDRRDPLALELGRHLGRLVGTHESRIVDLDPLEAAPLEHGREARPDGLDLGQLGHDARVVRALADAADRCFTSLVAVMAGIVGALVGAAIGVVFTEIVFANDASWPDVVSVALAVVGWLVAREALRQRRNREAEHRTPSASG